MDNEFEKVRDHISTIDMNTPAAAERIAEIERQIWVIKEHVRDILCTLASLQVSSPPHAHPTSPLCCYVAQQFPFGHGHLHPI
jgi:hypothetical protein